MKKQKQKHSQKPTEPESPITLPSSIPLSQTETQVTSKKLSCHNLKLNRFIDALVDDIMSPNLRLQWDAIRAEYHVLLNGNSISGMFRVYAEITRLQGYISAINAAVELLRKWYVPKAIEELQARGFDYAFTPETMNDDLEAVIIRSQTESLELEQSETEWNEIMKQNAGTKPTRDYFGGWLDAISQRNMYREQAGNISVADFCRQINSILQEVKKRQVM